jgi:hypothetical protein
MRCQVPNVVVNRATESAVQKSRKQSTPAVLGGAAVAAKACDSSSGGSPSPEKSEVVVPAGKPKRVRPVSSANSPATSLVATGDPVAPNHVLGVPAVPSAANVSRPRSKKLLQSGRCFAVCAFDTTVPVPLRVAVSNYDGLLVAIHNQVSSHVCEVACFFIDFLRVARVLLVTSHTKPFFAVFPGIQSARPSAVKHPHSRRGSRLHPRSL